jgi:pyruvate dehydrogenase E2 component (dihydrolipoamide acetyltransferase)
MPEVLMPRIDPGMQSGKIVEWLRKEGDFVQKGEPILVVEGEKTTFEIEAPDSGVLSKILVEVGTDVQVAQPVAIIGESEGSPQITSQSKPIRQEVVAQLSLPSTKPASISYDRIVASPAAKRLARDRGIDLANVRGTGPGGRITREDVLAVVEPAIPAARVVSKVREPTVLRKVKLEGIRKTVAERLTFSARNAVPVTLTMETDATKLVELKNKQDHVGFTAFAVKAVAKALEGNPVMNSTIEGEQITTYSEINVGVAINTDQGLVAPVIQNANKKPVKQINTEIEELSEKAKQNRLTIEELTGGTFTVTNLGAYDVESFAPVINPAQCAILGLGRIAFRPYAVGERVSARPATLLTFVFDHRIVDGVPAAKFLRDVKSNLEDPEGLL